MTELGASFREDRADERGRRSAIPVSPSEEKDAAPYGDYDPTARALSLDERALVEFRLIKERFTRTEWQQLDAEAKSRLAESARHVVLFSQRSQTPSEPEAADAPEPEPEPEPMSESEEPEPEAPELEPAPAQDAMQAALAEMRRIEARLKQEQAPEPEAEAPGETEPEARGADEAPKASTSARRGMRMLTQLADCNATGLNDPFPAGVTSRGRRRARGAAEAAAAAPPPRRAPRPRKAEKRDDFRALRATSRSPPPPEAGRVLAAGETAEASSSSSSSEDDGVPWFAGALSRRPYSRRRRVLETKPRVCPFGYGVVEVRVACAGLTLPSRDAFVERSAAPEELEERGFSRRAGASGNALADAAARRGESRLPPRGRPRREGSRREGSRRSSRLAAPPPGARVETRFDDGVRYAGTVAERLGPNRARIVYDDGDEETVDFPDASVTVVAAAPADGADDDAEVADAEAEAADADADEDDAALAREVEAAGRARRPSRRAAAVATEDARLAAQLHDEELRLARAAKRDRAEAPRSPRKRPKPEPEEEADAEPDADAEEAPKAEVVPEPFPLPAGSFVLPERRPYHFFDLIYEAELAARRAAPEAAAAWRFPGKPAPSPRAEPPAAAAAPDEAPPPGAGDVWGSKLERYEAASRLWLTLAAGAAAAAAPAPPAPPAHELLGTFVPPPEPACRACRGKKERHTCERARPRSPRAGDFGGDDELARLLGDAEIPAGRAAGVCEVCAEERPLATLRCCGKTACGPCLERLKDFDFTCFWCRAHVPRRTLRAILADEAEWPPARPRAANLGARRMDAGGAAPRKRRRPEPPAPRPADAAAVVEAVVAGDGGRRAAGGAGEVAFFYDGRGWRYTAREGESVDFACRALRINAQRSLAATNAGRERPIRTAYDAVVAGDRLALPGGAWDASKPPLVPPRAALEILGGEVLVDGDGRAYYRCEGQETVDEICDRFDVDALSPENGRLPHIARGAALTRKATLLAKTLVLLPEAALRSAEGASRRKRRKPCAACRLEGYVGALHCRETRRHDAPDFDAGAGDRVRTRFVVDDGSASGGPLWGWYFGTVVARGGSSIDVRYDDDPATTFTEPWPGDEVVVLPDDGSLPTAAPDEAAARARHVGRRLRLEGDDDQADWAAVSRCYVSYVEGFEGVVLGVERDGVVVDHLLADLDLGATWEDGGS